MPKKPPPHGDSDSAALLLKMIKSTGGGMNEADVAVLARQLLSVGQPARLAEIHGGRRPNRRRPRRADEVTYRVRIDVEDVKPPIWRRLELSSEMFLDELHQVIQATFEWTDSHLHRFAVGTSVWDMDAELYLCPFDVEEGEDEGSAENEVRLDEVLVEVGDRVRYAYDYGDGWEHVVRLEAIIDRPADAVRAVCIGGRRAGPPEDCGGPWGYQELVAAGAVDGEEFDVEEINAALSGDAKLPPAAADEFGPMAELVWQVAGHPVERELAELLRAAQLAEPVEISAHDAALMLRRYSWLLERVGDSGIKLSSAGYLPPADVEAAMTELEMTDEWFGKGNRENQTRPVLNLRESAQRLGLLRKHRGTLLLTRDAQKLRNDPVRLWRHIAGRLPMGADGTIAHHAGLVSLLGAAAGRAIDDDAFRALRSDLLSALGWSTADGEPLDQRDGVWAARDTVDVLVNMDAFAASPRARDHRETDPGGKALARAALQSRP